MSFNPSIPDSSDIISESQGDLLQNNQSLNTQIAQDHTALSSGDSNQRGRHKQVRFIGNLASIPSLVAGQSAVYSKEINSLATLFFASDPSTEIQLTNLQSTQVTRNSPAYPGGSPTVPGPVATFLKYTLPWGLFLYVGRDSIGGSDTVYQLGATEILIGGFVTPGSNDTFDGRIEQVGSTLLINRNGGPQRTYNILAFTRLP